VVVEDLVEEEKVAEVEEKEEVVAQLEAGSSVVLVPPYIRWRNLYIHTHLWILLRGLFHKNRDMLQHM